MYRMLTCSCRTRSYSSRLTSVTAVCGAALRASCAGAQRALSV